jgi:hypothetical protein
MSQPKRNIATATILIGILLLFIGLVFEPAKIVGGFGILILLCGITGKLVELIARSIGMK